MIKGANAVLNYFDMVNQSNDSSYIFWSVFKKGTVEKGNAILRTPTENWSHEKSRELLTSWLNLQQFGDFTIVMNDDPKASARGNVRQDFSIDSNPFATVQGVAIGSTTPPAETAESVEARVQKMFDAKVQQWQREKEIQELQEKVKLLTTENKDLEKRANDPWNKVINGIEPYMPHILQDMGIIKTRVAGVPQSEAMPLQTDTMPTNDLTEQDQDQLQQRIENVVEKMMQARPNDWLELLEMAANAIERKPSLGDTIKAFL